MAFLDNSGDIILDAVLTDTGRMRLAKGDGSFKITKFAFGDDEINYALYDKNHPSGSAYYDIEILQTPVLEAFTNNTSTLKSKLISISRTNLLYLPVVLRNAVDGLANNTTGDANSIVVLSDNATFTQFQNDTPFIRGDKLDESTPKPIIVDQGIESNEIGNGDTQKLDADLVETQFIVELDNRFGRLVSPVDATPATPSFIDDDNIASYYLSTTTNTNFFPTGQQGTSMGGAVLAGPRGSRLGFLVGPSDNLATSTYLFTQLGSTSTFGGSSTSVRHIDTTIRITGATTGYRVEIPIRFIKYPT
tara:strand:+ start:212 stop:1126 length:915 start_codon:yes stop_codon:yes gene_type:complete